MAAGTKAASKAEMEGAGMIYREFRMISPSVWAGLREFVKMNWEACQQKNTPIRIIVTTDERKRNAEQNKRLWGLSLIHI